MLLFAILWQNLTPVWDCPRASGDAILIHMTKPQARHTPIEGSALGALFVFQHDEFSCGPACLASAAALYGVSSPDYEKLRRLLNPNPQTGSDNFDMARVAEAHLPFVSSGEDCYAGGVAIANIVQEEGHYVLFLCREGDRVLFYDPYHHELVEDDIGAIEWVSESGHLTKWCINLAPVENNSMAKWYGMAAAPCAKPAAKPPKRAR